MKRFSMVIPLISLFFICCNTITGPFEDVDFGITSKKVFLDEMINNGIFHVYKEDKENPNDTTSIGFVLKKNDKEFPMRVHLNEEFYKGKKYDFGSLRRMEFRIGENTTEYGKIYRCSGKISKKFVDNLYQTYVEFYGQPDSIVVKNEYTFSNLPSDDYFAEFREENQNLKIVDKNYFSGKKAFWFEDKFILTFDIPTLRKPKTPNEKIYYQKNYEKSIIISYEMKGYNEELIRLKDSIAKELDPNDILSFHISSSKFIEQNQFSIRINSISLKDVQKADFLTEKISGFKYSLIIEDTSKEILYRKDNIGYDFEKKLGDDGTGIVSYDEMYLPYNEIIFDIDYEIPQYKKNNVKVKTIITELILEDGRILRGN